MNHLCLLINAIIENINNSALPEVNTVFANILHKGHGKAKNLDSSYRTISTCPLIAKVLDTYVGEIETTHWDSVQAETQFQGKGLSHEHSALLLTEVIQYALFEAKKTSSRYFWTPRVLSIKHLSRSCAGVCILMEQLDKISPS